MFGGFGAHKGRDMLAMIPTPAQADADVPAAAPARRPPPTTAVAWLAVAGVAVPYAVVWAAWRIADAAAGSGRDDAWWDAAAHRVYAASAAALVIGAWCSRPLFRLAGTPGQVALAVLATVLYLAGLLAFNAWSYMGTSGPFP
jgi:hypothetical protein